MVTLTQVSPWRKSEYANLHHREESAHAQYLSWLGCAISRRYHDSVCFSTRLVIAESSYLRDRYACRPGTRVGLAFSRPNALTAETCR